MLEAHKLYSVNDVAEIFGKTPGRIRQLCIANNWGQLLNKNARILTEMDIARMEKYFEESGYRPKRDVGEKT